MICSPISANPSRPFRLKAFDRRVREGSAEYAEKRSFEMSQYHSLSNKSVNLFAQLAQSSFEEMVRAFDQHQLFRLGHGRKQRFQLGARTKLVAGSADKQLGLGAILHELKCVHARLFGIGRNRTYGRSNSDDRTNPNLS